MFKMKDEVKINIGRISDSRIAYLVSKKEAEIAKIKEILDAKETMFDTTKRGM